MVLIGIVLFLLFWFLPSANSIVDRIMCAMGYACAALSFICGFLFLFKLLPDSIRKSYDAAERMANDPEKREQMEKEPAMSALRKTAALFIPAAAIAATGCIVWGYSWQHVGYMVLCMSGYYIYKYISLKKNPH